MVYVAFVIDVFACKIVCWRGCVFRQTKMFTNTITAGFWIEPQSHRSGGQVDPAAQLQKRLEPDSKSADLVTSLGGASCVQKRNNSRFIQGGAGIGCLQPIGGKTDMDPAFGFSSLENGVGSVLHEFVQLTIGVSTRQNYVFSLEVLGRVPRLCFVGLQALLALIMNKLNQLIEHWLVAANIHAYFKFLNGSVMRRFFLHTRSLHPTFTG